MARLLLALLASVGALWSADADPSDLLARIRSQMAEKLSRLPNYTCRETMERAVRLPRVARFETRDVVRLEVAYLDGTEMYAWPGSLRFGEQTIEELVPAGAIGTGNFGALAKAVFSSDAAVFTALEPTTNNGRSQVRFGFQVPRAKSKLRLQHGTQSMITGYRGFFTAYLDTLAVDWFQVDAENIPREIEILQAGERTEYSPVQIAGAEYLLPRISDATLFDSDGQISRNHITFDNCREFKGESTLRFTETDSGQPATAAPSPPQSLPPGIDLEIRLTSAVERGVTAIGDTVAAEITKEVHRPLEIPKGAPVTLRVLRLMDVPVGREQLHVVRFQLVSLEVGGEHYVAFGILEHAGNRWPANAVFGSSDGRVSFAGGPKLLLKPGLEMTWRSVAPPRQR